MPSRKKSFSLVELMVVIAIIGILSAIAMPTYKTYIIKARIASTLPILSTAVNALKESYDATGVLPNPLSVYNLSIPGNASLVALNSNPVAGLIYGINATNSGSICVFFSSSLGTPNYVAATGNNGTANRICMNIYFNTNDVYIKSCGIWGVGETMDIPAAYLPAGCNCNWIANASSGGLCNH